MIDERGVTLVGVSVGNLDDEPEQLGLPFRRSSGDALDDALDGVRERFGSSAITRAVQVGREQGISVPVLPDPPRPREGPDRADA